MLRNITDIAPLLADERKAGEFIEKLRWSNGVTCPLCDHDKVYECSGENAQRKQWKCAKCRKKFSVTSRSIFEGSHIPLGKWIYGIFLMCSSKKGVSSNQLMRELGISYRSAWFMTHRVREAIAVEPMAGMFGKAGAVVELDETYVGGKSKNNRHANKGPKAGRKAIVATVIEREGDVKTVHVPNAKKVTLQDLAKPIVDASANIMTDAHVSYEGLDQHFHSHHAVDHSKTFVRSVIIHTNFAESYHSLLKRGIIGTFHQISDKHLFRYLNEFDHKWNTRKMTDGERAISAIKAAPGKRLTYSVGSNSLIGKKEDRFAGD
jgi:transposase-like protein